MTESTATTTALKELQDGIFTMVVTMVKTMTNNGVTRAQAHAYVQSFLQSLHDGLQLQSQQEDDTQGA